MVDVVEILKIIDDWLAKTGETDASLSRKATGSPDTIRNWRRSLKSGKSFGVSTKSLEGLSRVVGFDLSLQNSALGDPQHPSTEAEVREALRDIRGLEDKDIPIILGIIMQAIRANSIEREHSQLRDQSGSTTLPHEEKPSRQR